MEFTNVHGSGSLQSMPVAGGGLRVQTSRSSLGSRLGDVASRDYAALDDTSEHQAE